jgi:hypothetical protein
VPGRLRTAQDQHAEIVEALRKRDSALAQEAVRRHIISAKENVLGFLRSRAVGAEGGPAPVAEGGPATVAEGGPAPVAGGEGVVPAPAIVEIA